MSIKGEFGPGIKSLIITLNHIANVSEPKINEFLENIGVHISKATISRILTKDIDSFIRRKQRFFWKDLRLRLISRLMIQVQESMVSIIILRFFVILIIPLILQFPIRIEKPF